MKLNLGSLDKTALHELFASAVTPRPIAFVSTIGADGVFNLAPFSFFAPLCLRPAVLAFSIGWGRNGRKKDTLKNIEDTKDFVFNIVTEDLAEAMNKSSCEYPSDVDEFKETGLTPVKATLVRSPLVAESPVNMECRLLQILKFGEGHSGNSVVIGEVLLAHVRDEFWAGDQIDAVKLKAIGRLGGDLYCRTRDLFEMKRPWWDPEIFKKEG